MTTEEGLPERVRQEIARASANGINVTNPARITHFFSSFGKFPAQAREDLMLQGFQHVTVDEEVSGDNYWHIAASTTAKVDENTLGSLEARSAEIAARNSLRYDGWKISK